MTRRRRHRQHGNPFNIRGPIELPNWEEVFGRAAPFAIDVGFAQGRFPVELARQHPQWNVLGLEIRDFWVEQLNDAARESNLRNLRAILANANSHLAELVPNESVIFVSVNFPDPWFKKRHRKRRVVNREWLDLIARKLMPKGELHYVSDYGPAAEEALELLREHPAFVGEDRFLETSTTGILTEREITHQQRGEPIYRLLYRRTGG